MSGIGKHPVIFGTLATSLAFSQPFSVYLEIDIKQQNEKLKNAGTLSYGTHNEAVNILQRKLKKLHLYEGEINGKFDVITEHYVKQFQRKYLLNVTGRVNKETLQKITELEREFYLAPLSSLEETTVDMGYHSEDVKKIQMALHYFGYYQGEFDGIYGPLTKQAAELFQTEHDIPVKTELDKQFVEHMQSIEERNKAVVHTVKKIPDQNQVKHNVATSDIVSLAKSYLGTPYVWGGESPSGFDCSGYLQYVFKQKGYQIPRTVSDIWNATVPVNQPSVGDLVFFETYKPGPSHAGIYLGNGEFIHAGTSGVTVSHMSTSYWETRYLGAKRVVQ
ncbi:C40 family peptidase [Salirhabdus salicampi]|uniref:C40 family peptidase n=1 Tax=Salirhabdus salicampi TaxID=476102 RepID=UPI0020C4234E|nr:NlpC/P60 family protein [Salirhabdus salicampi]MCP8616087.1 NlpC/P60 family protein [Salirhabdus salicampi]